MITSALASAYLTYVLTNTAGPFGIFDGIRSRFPYNSALGMFHCPWCMAIWPALLINAISRPFRFDAIAWDLKTILADAFIAGLLAWGIKFIQDFATAWLNRN